MTSFVVRRGRRGWGALLASVVFVLTSSALPLGAQTHVVTTTALDFAAQSGQQGSTDTEQPADATSVALPHDDRLRARVRFMAGYGHDSAQATLGLEKQGRVGYVIVELFGNINDQLSYTIEINPVDETDALPACGEDQFFFPNSPDALGPRVSCDPDGRTRVDDYRFVGLDLINQQGPLRQAYLTYQRGAFGLQFGRFIVPIGFHWEDVGSFTSKDATHIQRINAHASFGTSLSLTRFRVSDEGRSTLASVSLSAFLGEGNRHSDYDYFYFLDTDLDTNSALTGLVSGLFKPHPQVELRAAFKHGFTGSKVERLPNYFASKRHDSALVLSARYRPVDYVTAFGEWADYTWGPTRTSAELLGFDPDPIEKSGYYAGVDVSVPVTDAVRVGMVATREELSRDDSLIKFLSEQNLLNVSLGKKERSTVFRWYVDVTDVVTVAVYRNLLSNPFPWVSGIQPIAGPRAFTGRGTDKWGLVVRFGVP